jgi:hypothetical protein
VSNGGVDCVVEKEKVELGYQLLSSGECAFPKVDVNRKGLASAVWIE